MEAFRKELNQKDAFTKAIVMIFTAITGAMALNYFLVPSKIFSAGANGIAQIISMLTANTFHIQLDTGFLILVLNIPIAVLGFYKLGFQATLLSFINVAGISLATMLLPIHSITNDPLMNAVAGGFLVGIGAGYSLKYGFTTGGMDIVSLILAKTTGKTVGNFMILTNGLIILVAGALFGWESALYTIISIYTMSMVVDMIHTSHQKLTIMMITSRPNEMAEGISKRTLRGMTMLPSYGGYSKKENKTIMMVITRYELYDIEQIATSIDENVFINILPTQTVIGRFANEEQLKSYQKTGTFPDVKHNKRKRF